MEIILIIEILVLSPLIRITGNINKVKRYKIIKIIDNSICFFLPFKNLLIFRANISISKKLLFLNLSALFLEIIFLCSNKVNALDRILFIIFVFLSIL